MVTGGVIATYGAGATVVVGGWQRGSGHRLEPGPRVVVGAGVVSTGPGPGATGGAAMRLAGVSGGGVAKGGVAKGATLARGAAEATAGLLALATLRTAPLRLGEVATGTPALVPIGGTGKGGSFSPWFGGVRPPLATKPPSAPWTATPTARTPMAKRHRMEP